MHLAHLHNPFLQNPQSNFALLLLREKVQVLRTAADSCPKAAAIERCAFRPCPSLHNARRAHIIVVVQIEPPSAAIIICCINQRFLQMLFGTLVVNAALTPEFSSAFANVSSRRCPPISRSSVRCGSHNRDQFFMYRHVTFLVLIIEMQHGAIAAFAALNQHTRLVHSPC